MFSPFTATFCHRPQRSRQARTASYGRSAGIEAYKNTSKSLRLLYANAHVYGGLVERPGKVWLPSNSSGLSRYLHAASDRDAKFAAKSGLAQFA
jgi:hypothetical protein